MMSNTQVKPTLFGYGLYFNTTVKKQSFLTYANAMLTSAVGSCD